MKPHSIPTESRLSCGRPSHGLGYGRDDISAMMEDKTHQKAFSAIPMRRAAKASPRCYDRRRLGAIVAGMTATGSVVAVVGPVACSSARRRSACRCACGLGAGAVAGGIVGGFVGAGIGEHRAKEIEKGLRDGGILVAVKPKSHEHREHVRKAFGEGSDTYARAERGELDPTVDYAGDASEHVHSEIIPR